MAEIGLGEGVVEEGGCVTEDFGGGDAGHGVGGGGVWRVASPPRFCEFWRGRRQVMTRTRSRVLK